MADQVKALKKLEWLEDEPNKKITKGVPFNPSTTTTKDRMLQKSAENIFVPIGILATITCLALGLVEFQRGNSAMQQKLMRGRVALQAFSIGAMLFGTYFSVKKK